MCYTDDPIADFDAYDAEQNRRRSKLPVCADCDEPIQDDYAYYIHGEWICVRCMDDSYRTEILSDF